MAHKTPIYRLMTSRYIQADDLRISTTRMRSPDTRMQAHRTRHMHHHMTMSSVSSHPGNCRKLCSLSHWTCVSMAQFDLLSDLDAALVPSVIACRAPTPPLFPHRASSTADLGRTLHDGNRRTYGSESGVVGRIRSRHGVATSAVVPCCSRRGAPSSVAPPAAGAARPRLSRLSRRATTRACVLLLPKPTGRHFVGGPPFPRTLSRASWRCSAGVLTRTCPGLSRCCSRACRPVMRAAMLPANGCGRAVVGSTGLGLTLDDDVSLSFDVSLSLRFDERFTSEATPDRHGSPSTSLSSHGNPEPATTPSAYSTPRYLSALGE